VFTGGRQRQPNHNTTTYCVYWRTTTTTQSQYDHILQLLTDDNNDTLSSVSEHNMWSCYEWVVVVVFRLLTQHVVILWLGCRCCRPSVSIICGRVMIGLSLLSSVSKHNMWSYYDWVYCSCRPSVNIICGRIMIGLPHIVFTCGRQRQPNHNTTTYSVYWRTTTTTTQS
jgi:hypothetical protein